MNEQEHEQLIRWIPPTFSALREAVKKVTLVDRLEGRSLPFVAPPGTLVSEGYTCSGRPTFC